jgi:membrane-associated progesterone receptor component
MFDIYCRYNCFAGREASRAMAKLSFEEGELSNPNVDDLGPFERDTLDNWIDKFKNYRGYPIVGKVSVPPAVRDFKREDLLAFNGRQRVPEGRIHAPLYIGLGGKVLDVSYGGMEMYGEDGPYNIFAGIDASRALGKMSFDPADCASHDLSDLTEDQLKTVQDWASRLSKKYPVVGNLVD